MTEALAAPRGAADPPPPAAATWRWALGLTLALTLVRLWALQASPLQLFPDEAQYWVWSRDLAFGYFSKPPLVAWIIRLTTSAFGDAEPFVRLAAPLFHAAAGLLIYGAGRRLYGAASGLAALLIYQLMPAVQLGSFVISTDTPLCAFLALALWLYVELPMANGPARPLIAAGFGLALGLAFLAKYAALYALIAVVVRLGLSREARRAWTWGSALAAGLAFAAVAAPNLAWNAVHGFATVAHTAASARSAHARLFNIAGLGDFVAGQFGVFGPVPFLVLIGGAVVLARRRGLRQADLLLLCWVLPPLLIIAAVAFVSRAYANWAVAAYVPGSILAAAWLVRWRARRLLAGTVVVQALVAAGFLAGVVRPQLADRVGAGEALSRLRGWRELTQQMVARGRAEAMAAPLTAVAVDERFMFNEAAYYGRDYFGRDGPPLRAWIDAGKARSQAEMSAPLTPAEGGRVLVGSLGGWRDRIIGGQFAHTENLEVTSAFLDARRSRRLDLFVGEGFRPPR